MKPATSQIERETALTLGEFPGARVNRANCARQKLTKVRLSRMFGEKRSGLYIFPARRRLKILMQLDYKLALSPQVRESRKSMKNCAFISAISPEMTHRRCKPNHLLDCSPIGIHSTPRGQNLSRYRSGGRLSRSSGDDRLLITCLPYDFTQTIILIANE